MPDEPSPPLLTYLTVKGFQSLHHVSLPLAPFTVIVGPSSSGKSALTRALRTLVHNSRGTSYVTHGFPRTTISADIGHQGTLTLTRSATSSKAHDNAYVLSPPPGPHEDAPESVYTRLNGEVPDEVQAFLSLPRDPALTFASQFDKPYLLDASPQEVARTLAQLTSVHVILDAAREANRQRLTHAQTLRTRTTDLEAIRLRAEEFRTLAHARRHQDSAEDHLRRAHEINARIVRLRHILATLTAQNARMAQVHSTANIEIPDMAHIEIMARNKNLIAREGGYLTRAVEALNEAHPYATTPVPSEEPVRAAYVRYSAYRGALLTLRLTRTRFVAATDEHVNSLIALTQAWEDYADALRQARVCPTCGQSTDHLNADDIENRVPHA